MRTRSPDECSVIIAQRRRRRLITPHIVSAAGLERPASRFVCLFVRVYLCCVGWRARLHARVRRAFYFRCGGGDGVSWLEKEEAPSFCALAAFRVYFLFGGPLGGATCRPAGRPAGRPIGTLTDSSIQQRFSSSASLFLLSLA